MATKQLNLIVRTPETDGDDAFRVRVRRNFDLLAALFNSSIASGDFTKTGLGTYATAAHPLLDGNKDNDTLAAAPVRGDLIVGNATPLWARKAKGSANQLVSFDANDVVYVTVGGDMTNSAGAFTISAQAVTYAKIQNVTDARLLGRSAGSAGSVQEITVSGSLSLSGGVLSTTKAIPLTLFDHYADAGNLTATGETDLYSDTIAAGQLANNGEKLEAVYGGIFVGSATSTQDIKAYFGGTLIYDSGALSIGAVTDHWTLSIMLIRESSSVVRCTVYVSTDFGTSFPYSNYTRVTGLTLSSTNILKITGTSGGASPADNQIIAKLGTVGWRPAA